jgi:hypothetical protein
MDADAVVALVRDDGLAGVHADPDSHLPVLRPLVRAQRPLRLGGGERGVPSAREDVEERVALRVDLLAALSAEGCPHEPTVLGADTGPALAERACEPRRPLDVREEEGDRSTPQVGHGP